MYYTSKEYLNQYFSVTLPCSPRSKDLLSNMNSCLKSLNRLDIDISEQINQIKGNIVNAVNIFPSKYNRPKYTNEVCFIIHKFVNLFLKYQSLHFNRLIQIQKTISEFTHIISEYYKQNIPIQVYFQDFKSSIFDKVDKSITRTEFKLRALFNYAKNIQQVEKYLPVTENDLFIEMKKLSSEVDVENDYIHQNSFDIMFETYIESNPDLLINFLQLININQDLLFFEPYSDDNSKNFPNFNYKFNDHFNPPTDLVLNNFGYFINMIISKCSSATKKISPTLNSHPIPPNDSPYQPPVEFNIEQYSNLIEKVYSQITATSQIDSKMFVVLHCACLRYLSSLIYIASSGEWLVKPAGIYLANCARVLDESPGEVGLSGDLFVGEQRDASFRAIIADDFALAVDAAFEAQLFACPVDAWHALAAAVGAAMAAVKKEGASLAFDDFISVVIPVFAAAQIAAPDAMKKMLCRFSGIPKSNRVECAAVSAVAVADYLTNKVG